MGAFLCVSSHFITSARYASVGTDYLQVSVCHCHQVSVCHCHQISVLIQLPTCRPVCCRPRANCANKNESN
ncbi:hypothetical protein [Methanimicrococcus hacksteinii]|uniref:hypothetical protein n=1 Tax=Methanimicrococcus hacksteinii TaxID=3028293 RepID=UPI00298F07CC|nr:hypothetical protein [Methanimicrococcus sp. At1]